MNAEGRVRGVIFDMDNTLLASRIDYSGMKAGVMNWLAERGLLEPAFDPAGHTTSTLIERVKAGGTLTPAAEAELWTLVAAWEERGMRGAGAEPGMREAVASAAKRFTLTVLTNNAHAAAQTALQQTGMRPCFKRVFGREQAGALKPSPQGVRRILQAFPDIPPSAWISIGDSWIDGAASQSAGVPFYAYRADLKELAAHGVKAVARIDDLPAFLHELNRSTSP